jgi:UDP:flavonoid glycosyltransferase YjiC (YdhE family)
MRVLGCPIGAPELRDPILGTALELVARGHEVRMVAEREPVDLGTGHGPAQMSRNARHPASFAIPRWCIPDSIADQAVRVERALARYPADVLLTSDLALGPLIAAERAGLPVIVVGLMSYLWPADEQLSMAPATECGRYQLWLFDQTLRAYNAARERCRLRRLKARCDDRNPFLGDLLLLRNVPELVPDAGRLPATVRFVGPCRWEPFEDVRADVEWLAARTEPVVYVHLAWNSDSRSLWDWLQEALAGSRVAAVVELGQSQAERPADLPPHVRVVRSGRNGHVLARARAVISNGSTAPTLGGLCHGLPSLLAPSGAEQPIVASLCRRAGVSVNLDRSAPPRHQLRQLLEDESLHQRAGHARRLLCARSDSPVQAAEQVEVFMSAGKTAARHAIARRRATARA